MIKNRESAQASRQRKKMYIDELEAEIVQLRNQNTGLAKQVELFSNENRALREELFKIHSFVRKSGFPSSVERVAPHPKVSEATAQKVKTAGVCLLVTLFLSRFSPTKIMMFSFGLFFNSENGAKEALVKRVRELREPIPEVIPSSGSFYHDQAPKSVGRKVLQVEEDNEDSFSAPQKKIKISEQSYTDKGSKPAKAQQKRKFGDISEEEASKETNFKEFVNETASFTNISQLAEDSVVKNWFKERLKVRPNTAFFAVSDFQQIVVPQSEVHDKSPFYISLLVPARSLAAYRRLPSGSGSTDDSVVEIACQVVEFNQTCLTLDTLRPEKTQIVVT